MSAHYGNGLRPRKIEDDHQIVDLHNRAEPDGPPLDVDRFRTESASKSSTGAVLWVADVEGRLAGYGSLEHAWWTGCPDVLAFALLVDEGRRRRGVGSSLFELLSSEARSREAASLLAWVREDEPAGRSFAARRGFVETGQVVEEYRLDLQEAELAAYGRAGRRLRSEGLRITTLAEEELDRPLLERVFRLWAGIGGDEPAPAGIDFETFRDVVLDGPGLSPETHWIALEGARPVGMTFLKRLSPRAAENDYTVVDPTYRERGIAGALKVEAIRWGRESGLHTFYTSSERGNAAMISVNRRLGYRAQGYRLELAKQIYGNTRNG